MNNALDKMIPVLLFSLAAGVISHPADAQDERWIGRWAAPRCGAEATEIRLTRSTLDLSTFEAVCSVRRARQQGADFQIDATCRGEDGSHSISLAGRVEGNVLTFTRQRGFEFDPKRFVRCDAPASTSPRSGPASMPQPASGDRLPLRVGFYVESRTPCGAASNATLSLVRRQAISVSREVCHFQRVEKLGPTRYRVASRCDGGEAPVEIYDIPNETTYVVSRDGSPGYSARYCGQASLPQPWRTNDIESLVR